MGNVLTDIVKGAAKGGASWLVPGSSPFISILDELRSGEYQRRFEERVKLARNKKRAMKTASVSPDEEHQHAVISFADGAKVRKNLETLAEKLENVSNQRKNFINEVANAINATSDGSNSKYASFETGDGHIVTIRLANHNATVSNFDYKGELDGISIVVSPQKSRKQRRFNGKCHICCLKLASNGQKRKEVTLVTS